MTRFPWALLSGKKTGILILVLAICGRLALVYDFFSFDTDMMMQALAGQNLAEGHGLTIAQVHANDLSKVIYEPEVGWPPGYSLLVAAIYSICSKHIITASLIACMAGAIFFIIVFRWALQLLQLPGPVISLLVLFSGFSIPDYVRDSFPTDLMSAAFCLAGCCLAMRIMAGGKGRIRNAVLLGITLASAGWLRYMYIPVCFIPSLWLVWNGGLKKSKEILRAGLVALAINVLLIGALLIFQRYYTGQTGYIKNPGRGFFPGNLLNIYPFVFSSFVNLSFYFVQLSSFLHRSYGQWMHLFTIMGIIPLLFLLYLSVRYLLRRKMIANEYSDSFFMPAVSISLGIIVLLCGLSLTVDHYLGQPVDEYWTYVADRRYYCFIEFIVLIAAAWWLFRYSTRKNIWLKWLFVCVTGMEIFHGAYVIVKYVKGDHSVETALVKTDAIKKPVEDIIRENRGKGIRVVFTCTTTTFLGNTRLAGADCLYNYDEINGQIAASQPTLLILFVSDRTVNYFRNFITRKDVVRTMQIGEFHFYSCYIGPHGSRQ